MLASKDMIHAKGGVILLSYLKLLPLWIMVFPGMAARIMFPDEVACANPNLCEMICGSRFDIFFSILEWGAFIYKHM